MSHHVKRMEGRGLVARVECSEDGRGAFVVITSGRAAIEEAAPGHVRAVRRLMFDALSEEDGLALAAVIDKLLLDSTTQRRRNDQPGTRAPSPDCFGEPRDRVRHGGPNMASSLCWPRGSHPFDRVGASSATRALNSVGTTESRSP